MTHLQACMAKNRRQAKMIDDLLRQLKNVKADARDAKRLIHQLAAREYPLIYREDRYECLACNRTSEPYSVGPGHGPSTVDHSAQCPYKAARALVKRWKDGE